MELSILAQKIYEIAHLKGTFQLRSGQISHEYFDKYLFEADPIVLKNVAQALVPLIPAGTEVLAGLEMGGIPIVTALSLESQLPAAFVRKEAKKYGTAKLAEGSEIKDKRVCVVEDVITTGGQVILSTQQLRNEGAIVENVLCVIDRNEGGRKRLIDIGVHVHCLFTMEDLIRT